MPPTRGQLEDVMKQTASVGTSPMFLLFLTFLVLKLCGVIDWSWWWVTAPIWIGIFPLLVGLALIAVAKKK